MTMGHKKHHHRSHRETGGANEAAEDLAHKNQRYTYESKVNNEAEERKRGGKAEHREHKAHGGKSHHTEHGHERHHPECKCKKCSGGRAMRKRGGEVHVHREQPEHLKHAKHVGHVEGHHAKHHAGRMPRKSGGRTGADQHPYSSARKGSEPPGHKTEMEFE